jgi:hypothetical protein
LTRCTELAQNEILIRPILLYHAVVLKLWIESPARGRPLGRRSSLFRFPPSFAVRTLVHTGGLQCRDLVFASTNTLYFRSVFVRSTPTSLNTVAAIPSIDTGLPPELPAHSIVHLYRSKATYYGTHEPRHELLGGDENPRFRK